MRNSTKIGIAVLAIFIIGGTIGGIWVMQRVSHNEGCQKWLDHINTEKADLGNQLFPDSLNADVSNYNQHCAFSS